MLKNVSLCIYRIYWYFYFIMVNAENATTYKYIVQNNRDKPRES